MALSPGEWTAIIFLLVGLFLIFMEVLNPGFFIAVPGGTLAIMGAVGLAAPALMFGKAGWLMWPLAAGIATTANLFLYKKWAPPGKAPITSSIDSMAGKTGRVETEVIPGELTGKVLIDGQTWSARVEDGQTPITAGTSVRVRRVVGVHLIVEAV